MRVFNETGENLKEIKELDNLVEFLIEEFKLEEAIFSIIIVDEKTIQEINKEYRGIDKVTDVISFALEDEKNFTAELRVLGDVYICLEKAKNQALEYGHSLKRELSFLTVHGLLHLLGYEHEEDETEMFKVQKEVLEKYEKSQI